MELSYGLIFLATVLQFILGALWYSPLMFGKWWMEIMGHTDTSKEELQKMQREMMPFYALQFVLALITTFVLANNILYAGVTGATAFVYAFFMWFGYIAPIQIGSVIWGNTKKKFWAKQIFVMLSYQLVGILLATLVLTL